MNCGENLLIQPKATQNRARNVVIVRLPFYVSSSFSFTNDKKGNVSCSCTGEHGSATCVATTLRRFARFFDEDSVLLPRNGLVRGVLQLVYKAYSRLAKSSTLEAATLGTELLSLRSFFVLLFCKPGFSHLLGKAFL